MNGETRLIGEFVEERTDRLRDGKATIYSVTNQNGFVSSLDLFDKQVFSADTRNYKRVGFNDLAYNPSRINVGSVAICEDRGGAAVSPMYVVVRCRPSLRPRFLLHFLKSDVGLRQIRHRCEGAVRFQLKFRDLCNIPLIVPPLEEQLRIEDLLDRAEKLRELRDAASVRSRDLIPALFSETFGGSASAGHHWPRAKISDLGKVVTGNTPPRARPEYFGDHIDWIKTDNIKDGQGIVTRSLERLSELGAARGRVVPQGSVLVTSIAGSRKLIGSAAVTDREVAINQQINAIVPDSEVNSIFLCELVRSMKSVIQRRATGVMTGIINKSSLEQIEVFRPPVDIQKRFARAVESAHAMETKQSQSGKRLEDLFQSMLHRAFAGQI